MNAFAPPPAKRLRTLIYCVVVAAGSASLLGTGGSDPLGLGDGGSRALVTGQIMGQERQVCFDNTPTVPSDAPDAGRQLRALQDYILSNVVKLVRFDSGSSVRSELTSNYSCDYKLSPYLKYDYAALAGTNDLQQLRDWGTFAPLSDASGRRYVVVCVRDTQCEDGDILRITLNGQGVAETEIFNAPRCFQVPVSSGTNYLGVLAVNGTGFKGQCSFSDRNTGEVTVQGRSGSPVAQTYNVPGGAGSYGQIDITQ